MLTHHEKKNIATRIEQLKNKRYYKHIFKIVHDGNCNYTSNDNGVYLNINALSDETLVKIREFLDYIEKNKSVIPVPSEYTPYSESESSISMSTHDRNILRRMQDTDTNMSVWGTSECHGEGGKPKPELKPFLND
jgi:hypothetical protein